MPFITVIVTAFNRKEYIVEAVSSVLRQTAPRESYEIIVVKNYTDENIDNFLDENGVKQIVEQSPYWNISVSKAIEKSAGKVISFLDDDDLFDEHKLEVLQRLFISEDIVFCKDGIKIVDENGTNIGYRETKQKIKEYFFLDKKGSLSGDRRFFSSFNNSSMTVLRDSFESHLKKLNSNVPDGRGCRHSMDNFIVFASLESGKCVSIPEKLTLYRLHSQQITARKGGLNHFTARKLEMERLFRESYSSMRSAFTSREILRRIDDIIVQSELQISILSFKTSCFSPKLAGQAIKNFLDFHEKYVLILLILYLLAIFSSTLSSWFFRFLSLKMVRPLM